MTEAEWGPGNRMAAPPETPEAEPAETTLVTRPVTGPRHALAEDAA